MHLAPHAVDPRALLRAARPDLAELRLERRAHDEEKTVWMVGRRHVLRFATRPRVRGAMRRERALLRRLDGRLGFAVPRPVCAAGDGSFDLLERVPGEPVVSWDWWSPFPVAAQRAVAEDFGRFLAALHQAMPVRRARSLGVPEEQTPPSAEWVRERIDGRLEDPVRQRLFDDLLPVVPQLYRCPLEPVLLHDDLSHHNAAFDPDTGAVRGFFDFTSARVGDPHRDLRYAFTFEPVAEHMIATYESLRGIALDRARLRALHIWSAFGALAWDLSRGGANLALRWGWIDHVAGWDRSFLRVLS